MEKININQCLDKEIMIDTKAKPIYSFFKRVFDIISSLLGIIILSPIIFIVAILVRVGSEGPIIFGHERIGKNNKRIKVYKFRSMYNNSKEIFESFTEEQKREYYINFKLDNDPRITKIGAFLRKTSLDELPQLINVLKGDMTLVGPRPIVEAEIDKYGPYFNKFISVTPGVTGYWQAHGRSDTTYDERVQMDMYYIDNRSFFMDIKILFETVIAVIRKEGAK